MLNVQNNFSTFEAHIVQTIQQGLAHFTTTVNASSDQDKATHVNIVNMANSVRPLGEWHGFVRRNNNVLIDPSSPARNIDAIAFPNQKHASTQPLIQGSLERKSGLLKKYDASFYVVTPSKYLHEFKSDDFSSKDPSPEMSLYLPDCTVGAVANGTSFNIRGKDATKSSLSSKLSSTHEYSFRAHSDRDAEQWVRVLREVSGVSSALPNSTPASPVSASNRTFSGHQQQQPTSPRAEQLEAQQQHYIDQQGEGNIPYPQHAGYGVPTATASGDAYPTSHDFAAGAGGGSGSEAYAARSGVQGRPGEY